MKHNAEISNGKYRPKFLKIIWLLKTYSNEKKPFSTQEIIKELTKYGVSIDRRTLSREMQMLKENGVPIVFCKKGHQLAYYYDNFDFTESELNLLINAVNSSSFVSTEDTKYLTKKLIEISKANKYDLIDTDLIYYNVIKQPNIDLFENIKLIQKQINNCKQISFYYYDLDYNGEKEYRKNKKLYTVNPIAIVFNEDFFYMIVYNNKYKNENTYRIDRMNIIYDVSTNFEKINNEKAIEFMQKFLPINNGTDDEGNLKECIEAYAKQSFKMYGGRVNNVILQFEDKNKKLLNCVFDKFGIKDRDNKKFPVTYDENNKSYKIVIHVQTSNTFYGWLVQFGGAIKIIGPKSVVKEYKEFCKKIVDSIDTV